MSISTDQICALLATYERSLNTSDAALADGVLKGEQPAWLAWVELPAGEHEARPYGHSRLARARLSADAPPISGTMLDKASFGCAD